MNRDRYDRASRLVAEDPKTDIKKSYTCISNPFQSKLHELAYSFQGFGFPLGLLLA